MQHELPPRISPTILEAGLDSFVASAVRSLGADLRSITLYGSAATGQQRATSDVNVILVLSRVDLDRLEGLREPLRHAHAALRLEAMFVHESELSELVRAFADKFADVHRRRRVLHGEDVFAALLPTRRAQVERLRQVLLNQMLRLRQRYLLVSLRDEQATLAVAHAAGPMRAFAASLRELEGKAPLPPKEALSAYAEEQGSRPSWIGLVSQARETRSLPPGEGPRVLRRLLELAEHLHALALAVADT